MEVIHLLLSAEEDLVFTVYLIYIWLICTECKQLLYNYLFVYSRIHAK